MASLIKTLALILKTRDIGEADRVVVFLTPAAGQVTALAKHARKSRRRYLNCLEPCSLVQVLYREKPQQELAYLESGELVEAFPEVRQKLTSLAAAACLSESALELVGATDNLEELFAALQSALRLLAAGLPSRSLLCSHLVRVLALGGYGPRWQACQICGQTPAGLAWFSPQQGGILCPNCLNQNRGERLYLLHPGTRKLVLAALNLPLQNLARLRFPALAQTETLTLLRGFIRFILGKDLNTLAFLDKVDWS